MGFDLYGMDASTKNGEYFRNNVWWWRPLWSYCHQMKLITNAQFRSGQSNDGYKILRRHAYKMGVKLLHLIEQGETQKYMDEYKKYQESLPLIACECKGENKSCGLCDGTGQHRSWGSNYPFDIENVQNFAKFCMESGGFEIC